jgi:hypothetical protein
VSDFAALGYLRRRARRAGRRVVDLSVRLRGHGDRRHRAHGACAQSAQGPAGVSTPTHLATATARLLPTARLRNCAAEVGQSPADFKPISCDEPRAVVEVASRSDSNTCPDGKRAGTGESGYGNITNGSTAYCFIPNLKESSCYIIDTSGEEIRPADCSASLALRIAKRICGITDESVSAADSKPLVYTTPPRVYCVEKP